MNPDQIKISRYFLLFTAYYVAGVTLINILSHVFNLELGSAISFAIFFSAAYSVAVTFVKDTQRAPSVEEKRKLSIACILSSIAVSLLYFFIALPLIVGMEDAKFMYAVLLETPFITWVVLMSALIAIQYLILHFIFGWFSIKMAKKLPSVVQP